MPPAIFNETTWEGGNGSGAVSEMTLNGSGDWTQFQVHYFGFGNDGVEPVVGLIFGAGRNLHGTTTYGRTRNI